MGFVTAFATTKLPPLYVAVHVPEFPAQARLRLRPELRQSAVVLLAGEPPFETVLSANRKALHLGVRHGMTKRELDGFDGMSLLKESAAEEAAARGALLELAGRFTPRVQVSPAGGVGDAACGMVLDMTGSGRLLGSVRQAVGAIRGALASLSLTARLAVSGNYYAAVCAATFAGSEPIVLEAGREREGLSGLPLSALGLTEQQRSTFELWGLRTLGELAAMPEVELVTRLGQSGRRLWLLARGEHPHLMRPEEPVFTLKEYLAFEVPEERLESLVFVLGPMLDQLIGRAQAHALALASVTVRLELDGGGEHSRTLKPALPVAERAVLLRLLQLDLEAHPPAAAVLGLHLSAEPGERSKVQGGLFQPPLPEPGRLDVTLARIAALVGEDRVGRARLLDTHRADGFMMERFLVPETPLDKASATAATVVLRRLRPAWPLRLELSGDRPGWFYLEARRYSVTEAYGPWRRSGQWWTEEIWSREEWDVHASAGDETLVCLLARDLLQKTWHLEALYD